MSSPNQHTVRPSRANIGWITLAGIVVGGLPWVVQPLPELVDPVDEAVHAPAPASAPVPAPVVVPVAVARR